MRRVTISIDDDLGAEFDGLIQEQGYDSRSEAVRDLVRQAVEARRLAGAGTTYGVASLSYVYDHHTRALAQRLTDIQHRHHEVVVATMHVHLDHEACLETVTLRGPTVSIRALADTIQAERGVRFAKINMISARPNDEHSQDHGHDHGQDHGRGHVHGPHGHFSPPRG